MGTIREVLEIDASQAVAALNDVSDATARTDGELLTFADTADHLGAKAGKLAQGLGVISPGAQQAAMVVADLGDALSLVGTAGGAAVVGVGAVYAGALLAVVGVAALGKAMVDLTLSSADALPALRELEAASGVMLVPRATAERIEDTTAAIDAARMASTAAGASLADVFSPAIGEGATLAIQLSLALRDITIRGADMGMAILDIGVAMADGFMMPLTGAVGALGALLLTAGKAADVLGRDGLAADLREAGTAAMTFASGGALSGGLEELRAGLAGYRDEALALVDAQKEINAGGDEVVATLDDAAQAEADFVAGVEAGIASLGDLFSTTDLAIQEANAAVDDTIAAINGVPAAVARAQASTSSLVQGLGGVGAGLQTAARGDAIGMLAATGPQGAAVAAVLSGLSAIGEQGADAIADSIKGQIESITAGLEALPELVGMLPSILADTAPDFIAALLTAAPELAMASVKAQFELADYLITEMPGAIGEAIGEKLAELWNKVQEFLSNPISSMRGTSDNTFWEKVQNTAVDIGRVIAGAATLGLSEVAIGVANGATDGGAREAMYAGDREARRSGGRFNSSASSLGGQSAAGAMAGGYAQREALGAMLMPALNRADRRDNLTSSSGVRYGVAGPVRAT